MRCLLPSVAKLLQLQASIENANNSASLSRYPTLFAARRIYPYAAQIKAETTMASAVRATETAIPSAVRATENAIQSAGLATETRMASAVCVTENTKPSAVYVMETTIQSAGLATETMIQSAVRATETTIPSAACVKETTIPSGACVMETTIPSTVPMTKTTIPSAVRAAETTRQSAGLTSETKIPSVVRATETTTSSAVCATETTISSAVRMTESTMPVTVHVTETTIPSTVRETKITIPIASARRRDGSIIVNSPPTPAPAPAAAPASSGPSPAKHSHVLAVSRASHSRALHSRALHLCASHSRALRVGAARSSSFSKVECRRRNSSNSPSTDEASFPAIITAQQLKDAIQANSDNGSDDDLVIVQASVNGQGNVIFSDCRLPSSVLFDINACSNHHSRFSKMLPSSEHFEHHVNSLGIGSTSHVIIYDPYPATFGLYAAPRLWWMFRTFGHHRVCVLDGGLRTWLKDSHPIESGALENQISKNKRRRHLFVSRFCPELVTYHDEILDNVKTKRMQILDARTPEAFRGTNVHTLADQITEKSWKPRRRLRATLDGRLRTTLDGRSRSWQMVEKGATKNSLDSLSFPSVLCGVKGASSGFDQSLGSAIMSLSAHIPGATNIYFRFILDADEGRLKSKQQLLQLFQDAGVNFGDSRAPPLTVYCQSGIASCGLALAAHVCGKEDVSVYDGSWEEWSLGREKAI